MWHIRAPLRIWKPRILRRLYARAILSRYQSATRKLFVYGLVHTQFLLFYNTLLCPRNSSEPIILCVMLLCPNKWVDCYRNVRETQWIPNKPKARRLWPTYRLTSVSVNTPSNSSLTQSQTKIVGTLKPNAVFPLLVLLSSLSKLFIAVWSANLVHQHWGDKETPKCPNHFDWDCSLRARENW